LQVGIDHPAVARFYMPVYFAQRILAAQARAEAVASRLELMLKDRLDYQLQGRLNDAILYSGYTERATSFTFRYVDAPHRLRAIATILQCLRQFSKVAVPRLRESLHAHAVHSRRPGVLLDLSPPQPERVQAKHLVNQTMPFTSFNSVL
jgi:hypothetical protein